MKEMYIGVNDEPHVVSDMYIGVGNKARQVIKGYVGDENGKARLFYLLGLIPRMTDNIEPYGIASAGDGITPSDAYHLFDRRDDTYVGAASENVYGYCEYRFAPRVDIDHVKVIARQVSLTGTYRFTLKITVEKIDSTWEDYQEFTLTNQGLHPEWEKFYFAIPTQNVRRIKIETLTQKVHGQSYHIARLQAYGEVKSTIYSREYANANIYDLLTICTNNGQRSPVFRESTGDAVAFISMNGLGTGWGGNWIATVCIALSQEEALLREQSGTGGVNCHAYTIDGVTYWVALQASNRSWGGATQITSNPGGIPVFDDLYICNVNASPSIQRVRELIEMFDIKVRN